MYASIYIKKMFDPPPKFFFSYDLASNNNYSIILTIESFEWNINNKVINILSLLYASINH